MVELLRWFGLGRFILASVISAGFISGCVKSDSSKPGSPELPVAQVRVQVVTDQPQTLIEEVVGTVRAKERANLEARVSGRIRELAVVVGQGVKAGDLLVRLDAVEIDARLEQANVVLGQAERDWKRIAGLFEQQTTTKAEYEAAEARYQGAKGAQAEARAMMSYLEVLAPFEGVVTKKWVEAGDQAAPGKLLLALENTSALELEADVPEGIIGNIRQDQQLCCRVDGVSGEVMGIVSEIGPSADQASRTFRIKLKLSSQPGLSPGRFARVSVPIGETKSLRVPVSACVRRGQLEMVFAIVDKHAQMRLVKTGKQIGNEIEVLSGLVAEELVVIDLPSQLTDGQPVEAK